MPHGTKIRSSNVIRLLPGKTTGASVKSVSNNNDASDQTTLEPGIYMPIGVDYKTMTQEERANKIYTAIVNHITPDEAQATLQDFFNKMETSSFLRGWIRLGGVDDPSVPLHFKRKTRFQMFVQGDRNEETVAFTYGLLEKTGWLASIKKKKEGEEEYFVPDYVQKIKDYLLAPEVDSAGTGASRNLETCPKKFRNQYLKKSEIYNFMIKVYESITIISVKEKDVRQMLKTIRELHLLILNVQSDLRKNIDFFDTISSLIKKYADSTQRLLEGKKFICTLFNIEDCLRYLEKLHDSIPAIASNQDIQSIKSLASTLMSKDLFKNAIHESLGEQMTYEQGMYTLFKMEVDRDSPLR